MKNKRMVVLLCCWLTAAVIPGAAHANDSHNEAAEQAGSGKSAWQAPQQVAAMKFAAEILPLVKDVLIEKPSQRRKRLAGHRPKLQDISKKYFLLNSPIINAKEDYYLPVRFMHAKHALLARDCFTCHHHRPADPQAKEMIRCSACHQDSFNPATPNRPGLKAAYHRRCVGCHEQINKGPIDCLGCHDRRVPDHEQLVKIEEDPDPEDVTAECLRCHDKQAGELMLSAHWLWKGPTPYVEDHEKDLATGKANVAVNNFCISIASNWRQCTACHAGYGWVDNDFDFTDKRKMDCLVCHDTTDTYVKAHSMAGFPDEDVDLVNVAKHVGKPSRQTCGDCHFSGGGGDSVKHGDMNRVLYYPDEATDVHMGGYDFQCHECHKTNHHKISGRSFLSPAVEGTASCEGCHTLTPHQGTDILSHHLNNHCKTLACATCHIPVYAQHSATKTYWDWSKSGDKLREAKEDQYGHHDYSLSKGEFLWSKGMKPTYAWYNGKVSRYLAGDKINTDGVTTIVKPIGDINDPGAKIFPYKLMTGRQGADAEYNYLLVGHVYGPGGYILTLDWQKSFREGMEELGIPYSGRYKWVDTEMYISLNHEVPPKEIALSCVQCHSALSGEHSCDRCHRERPGLDFKKLARENIDAKMKYYKDRRTLDLVNSTDYLGFKALGYQGDPIETGGRFTQLPLGYKPQ